MQEKLDEALRLFDLLEAEKAAFGIDRGESFAQVIQLAEIAFITLRDGRVIVVLVDGSEVQARPSETLTSVGDRLKPHPNFVRSHNGYLVNLDQVDEISQTSKSGAGDFVLHLMNGAGVPLLQNQQAVMDYFSLESLEHVVPWNERLGWVLKENLRDFEKDLRMVETEELRRLFSDGTGQLIVKQLVGNIVWQAYNWVKAGKIPAFDGNIRSFWYSHIKPVLARLLPEVGDNQYQGMIEVFSQYVGDYHLFHYADFGFVNDDDALRAIGREHPQIIIFAEKKGHWRTLQKIQAQTGATVICLGGQPSLMTTEYFINDLEKVTDLDQTFHLITDVDFDPSGQIIAESFRDQLGKMGIRDTTMLHHIIKPDHFKPEEIKFFKYVVPQNSPSDRKKVSDWLFPSAQLQKRLGREPAGIVDENGVRQPWGLESDAMPKDRLMDYAAAAVKEVLSPPDQRPTPVELEGFPYPLA